MKKLSPSRRYEAVALGIIATLNVRAMFDAQDDTLSYGGVDYVIAVNDGIVSVTAIGEWEDDVIIAIMEHYKVPVIKVNEVDHKIKLFTNRRIANIAKCLGVAGVIGVGVYKFKNY